MPGLLTPFLALLYSVFRLLLDAFIDRRFPEAELRLELLVLRHQVGILQRQVKGPPWRPADRLLLAGLSQRLPRPSWLCFLVSPATLRAGIAILFGANGLCSPAAPGADAPT